MKKLYTPTALFSSLFFFIILMSSFSLNYSREDSREDKPRVSQKEQRRTHRLERRKARVEKKLKKAKSSAKRQKLKKRIRGIQQKKDRGNPVFGIIGFVFAVLAFILFVAFLVTLIMSIGIGPLLLSIYILIGGCAAAIIGLTLSILGMVLNAKDPDKWSARGLSIAGMIVASVMCGIWLIFGALYFAFL